MSVTVVSLMDTFIVACVVQTSVIIRAVELMR